MDEQGIYRATEEDWDVLADMFSHTGNILFAYSYSGLGCLIINLNEHFYASGDFPFGGNPRGRVWVSVLGLGAYHFSMSETHPYYIREKLQLSGPDAEGLSELFRELWKRLGEKQQ